MRSKKWAAVGVEMRNSRAASLRISISISSSLVYASAVMYTKTCTSGGQISSNFEAINMAATPTSCNCHRGTGRRSRYWSIRRTVKNRAKGAENVVRCDVDQPIDQNRPHLGVQLRLGSRHVPSGCLASCSRNKSSCISCSYSRTSCGSAWDDSETSDILPATGTTGV